MCSNNIVFIPGKKLSDQDAFTAFRLQRHSLALHRFDAVIASIQSRKSLERGGEQLNACWRGANIRCRFQHCMEDLSARPPADENYNENIVATVRRRLPPASTAAEGKSSLAVA